MQNKTIFLGSFCLIDKDLLLLSKNCSSVFPNGEIKFFEDKIHPPNRAYLKLWEIFTLIQKFPKRNDFCLDLGASPGGWTWVLCKLEAKVLAIDRAELDEQLFKIFGRKIQFRKQDAFKLNWDEFSIVDWLFCDVICYPHKLYEFIMDALEHKKVKNYVCTIKFQGDTDFEIIQKFNSIPNSKVFHLSENKHELTWVKMENKLFM